MKTRVQATTKLTLYLDAGEIEIFNFTKKEWSSEITCGSEPRPGSGNAIHPLGETNKVITISGNSR